MTIYHERERYELSEGEETKEQGILDTNQLDAHIQRATRNYGGDATSLEESQVADISSSISPDNDPINLSVQC